MKIRKDSKSETRLEINRHDAKIKEMVEWALSGSGQSFEIYESRLRDMVEGFVQNLSDEDKSYVLKKTDIDLNVDRDVDMCVFCGENTAVSNGGCTDCVL